MTYYKLFSYIIAFVFTFLSWSVNANENTALQKYIHPLSILEQQSGLSGVDCIYCINLDKRVEKWQRMTGIFAKSSLHVNRVSGINGYVITEDEKLELSAPYPPQLKGTQIGCLLSHLSIIHDAYNRNFQTIWIMEDDVEFIDQVEQISKRIEELNSIDPQWDILYTDADMRYPNQYTSSSYRYHPRPDQHLSQEEYQQPRAPISNNLMRIRHRWGTHSMIISRSGIEKIRTYFNTWGLWEPIDVELHYIPEIHEYACTHDIVTNWIKSVSDIADVPLKQVALISNWPVQTLPAKFENVKLEYQVQFFETRICETNESSLNPNLYKKIILFNPYLSPKRLSTLPKAKMILFVWEPEILPKAYYDTFSLVYTWDDSLIDNKKFFKFYYPHALPMNPGPLPFEKKKLSTMIASHWVPHRLEILNFFLTQPLGEFEFYGRTCPAKPLEPMYKGPIPGYHSGNEKISTLQQYRFCFCSENSIDLKGYITEKIFDCFAAGSVPIYRGASNIADYIPKECFIDRRDFASNEELYQFIKNMSKETHEQYLNSIQKYLASEKAKLFSKENFNKILYEAVTHE